MKKADIKLGVIYAYQRGRNDSPDPVVFLVAPSDGKLYQQRDRYTRTGPAFRPAGDNAKPERSRIYGPTGYAVAKSGYGADRSDLSALTAATLADFEAATSAHSGPVQFDVLVTLGQITGLYEDVAAAHKAQQQREREHIHRQRAAADRDRERAGVLIGAFSRAGIETTTGDVFGSRKILLTLDEAEKLAALLES